MSQGPNKMTAEAIAALRQLGGPFIVRLQRREGGGRLLNLAYWENQTIEDLTGPIEDTIFRYSGGGDYMLSIYTPDDRVKSKHVVQISVPGDPRIPNQYQTQPVYPTGAPQGAPGMPFSPFSPPQYPGMPGMPGAPGMTPGNPWQAQPGWGSSFNGFPPFYFPPPFAGGYVPGSMGIGAFPGGFGSGPPLPAQPLPVPQSSPPPGQFDMNLILQHKMHNDQMNDDRRRARQEEIDEAERRERMRREQERIDRLADPTVQQMLQTNQPKVDPAVEALKAQITAQSAAFQMLQEQLTRGKLEDQINTLRADSERARQEAEKARREDAERFHREQMEARRDSDAKALEARKESDAKALEAKKEADARLEKLLVEWRQEKTKAQQPNHVEDLKRLEDRFLSTTDRQKEVEDRRRVEEEARRQNDLLRAELVEARRTSDSKFTELMLAGNKKDDTGMLTALGAIFGKTLEGSQNSSSATISAITTAMEAGRRANELPEWMGNLISKQTNRSDEMGAITQSAGQLMSIAFGTMSQSLQQMAAMSSQQDSPWVRIAEGFFREVGVIGEALISRGMVPGMGPQQGEAIPLGGGGYRQVQPGEQEPIEVGATPVTEDVPGAEAEVPQSTSDVTDAAPVSPAQVVATRIRQLSGAIQRGLGAREAAKALVDVVQFEAAYSGDEGVPEPLRSLADDPAGVLKQLFGPWLLKYGETGEKYIQTMSEWVAKFLAEGLPDEDEEAEEDAEDAEGEEQEEVAAKDANGGSNGASAAPTPAAPAAAAEPVVVEAKVVPIESGVKVSSRIPNLRGVSKDQRREGQGQGRVEVVPSPQEPPVTT